MARESGSSCISKLKLPGVIVVSFVWVAIAVALFMNAAPCCESATGFWAQKVTCLPPNEMGDFLAGVFAPLAFLWLIAAVFLQREELSAQRQELMASRNVAQQHVEEAKKNVTFIEEQTKLLADQRKQAEQENADRQIDQLIKQIDSFFSRIAGNTLAIWKLENEERKLKPIEKKQSEPVDHYIMKSIARFDTHMTNLHDDFGPPTTRNFQKTLNFIISAMNEVDKIQSRASKAKKFQVKSLDFDRMRRAHALYKIKKSN
jgi:hypothetical protein